MVEVYPHTKLDGNRKNFLWTYGRTDGRTHLSSNLLGHRRGDDLKIEYVSVVNSHVSNIRELGLFHLLYTTERCVFVWETFASVLYHMVWLYAYFAFSALTLFDGRQEGHPACKN